jgi:uncharacterized protein YjbJ (UPF0337 family)
MAKNSRARGRNQALVGKGKQGVGKLIGNQQMQAEGATEVMQGEADEAAVKASERVIGAVEVLSGTIKRTMGDMIKSPKLSHEGQTEAITGKHRQKVNQ